ncbi:MAG: FecR domain-containing protein [Fidelibacterota bacterium]
MKLTNKISGVLITLIVFLSFIYAAERVAVVTKVKGSVEVKTTGKSNFAPLKKGFVLNDRDLIRTGSDGALVVVYLDDKSMLKVKANTDLEIRGTRSGEGLSKKVDMMAGTLKANVSKQRKGDFAISTPTSVASVKGTEFWIMSDPLLGDKLIGIEGLVELLNLVSGEVINVGVNQTGTSTPNGTLNVEETNPEDIPEDIEVEEEIHELRIQLQDVDGQEKELIIKFQ